MFFHAFRKLSKNHHYISQIESFRTIYLTVISRLGHKGGMNVYVVKKANGIFFYLISFNSL
jgi:hypothetical protein